MTTYDNEFARDSDWLPFGKRNLAQCTSRLDMITVITAQVNKLHYHALKLSVLPNSVEAAQWKSIIELVYSRIRGVKLKRVKFRYKDFYTFIWEAYDANPQRTIERYYDRMRQEGLTFIEPPWKDAWDKIELFMKDFCKHLAEKTTSLPQTAYSLLT